MLLTIVSFLASVVAEGTEEGGNEFEEAEALVDAAVEFEVVLSLVLPREGGALRVGPSEATTAFFVAIVGLA